MTRSLAPLWFASAAFSLCLARDAYVEGRSDVACALIVWASLQAARGIHLL